MRSQYRAGAQRKSVRPPSPRQHAIPCIDCKSCLPSSNGVNIPRVLKVYNKLMMYGDENRAQMVYNTFMKEEERADLCIECGECLEKCPQMIEIPGWLKKAHKALCTEEASSTA